MINDNIMIAIMFVLGIVFGIILTILFVKIKYDIRIINEEEEKKKVDFGFRY